MAKDKILVVDDEKSILDLLYDFLSAEGFNVTVAGSGVAAVELLKRETYSLVLTDLKMPDMNGLELIEAVRALDEHIVCIIMTGYGTLDTALHALKGGVFDYILKPFKVDQVVSLIRRGLETRKLREENLRLRESVSLFKMNEAARQPLQDSNIFDLTVETIFSALDPDLLTFHFKAPDHGSFFEIRRRHRFSIGAEAFAEVLSQFPFEEIADELTHDKIILNDQNSCAQFFKKTPTSASQLFSHLAVAIKMNNQICGYFNAFNIENRQRFTEGQRKAVTLIADRAASLLENAELNSNIQSNHLQTVEGLAKALEAKDRATYSHSRRVSTYAAYIAERLSLPAHEVENIRRAALLHDIGKIGVELNFINQPGALDRKQLDHFQAHPEIGRNILEPMQQMAPLLPIVYHHHEHFDGNGYPAKLRGEEIPLGARILAIADAYDAMTSDRPYRGAIPYELAVAELKKVAGFQFDPKIVDFFVAQLQERVKQGQSPTIIEQGNQILF